MAKWTNYFKIITPQPSEATLQDNQALADPNSYSNFSWYQRLVQGNANRVTRYREYDLMDSDVDITRALDTIAEEMIGNDIRTAQPLIIEMVDEEQNLDVQKNDIEVLTLKVAIKRWCRIHKWDTRLFHICRALIKYGDVYFRRDKTTDMWEYVPTKNVAAAIVDANNITKVLGWHVNIDDKKANAGQYGSSYDVNSNKLQSEIIPASKMVRFTLNDDMSESAPFGDSVLRSVYRVHKQKLLLEDAIIIYRIQRAPERRVFYIDVGKMPPQRVKQYLEGIKNEIKQKKIPSFNGGMSEVDTSYNPHSMVEDFFFAQRADGRGSKVETLPAGQNLGELTDLEYFKDRVNFGLRIPSSYFRGSDKNGAIFNDGKVGVAYIEETRFALFINRLQSYVESVMDTEFKKYLKACDVYIDEQNYLVRLPEPSNFNKYKQQEIDSALMGVYASVDAIPHLSKRFALIKYAQFTDEEIATNERMKLQELGMDPDVRDDKTLSLIYGVPGADGGMGGAMPGGMGGEPLGMTAGMGDMGMEPPGMEGGDMGMGGDMGGAPPPAGGATPPIQ